MSDTVIRVENLGKKYIIGHQQQRYTALRDVIANRAKALLNPFQKQKSKIQNSQEEFWALKDVSFEIKQGDRVGIIGRNGAGKSTLLKILSRITEPTKGRVRIQGRVASLLEVGTGFHPELTGRENIYLNGAILGMSKAEIKKKFDEIVAFAEIEKFLDTPVKRYSSGMYVRLAFAVAAHLEPEILVVDEVLAVGDAQFQKKCLGKMESATTNEGKTLLFVSHDMTAIQTICSYIIHLNSGKVIGIGLPNEQVEKYLNIEKAQLNLTLNQSVQLSDTIQLRHLNFIPNTLKSGDASEFNIEFYGSQTTNISELALLIYSLGIRVGILDLRPSEYPYRLEAQSSLSITGLIQSLPLVEGDYNIGIYINSSSVKSDFLDLFKISVFHQYTDKNIIPFNAKYRGILELKFSWSEKIIKNNEQRDVPKDAKESSEFRNSLGQL